ncbi:protein Hook homolog 3-like [Planococcus citri]|uniref:protein Hook homolog 3-like n=1 Tax=Planococcus citri TaxID=170843 RepID=UPI0031F82BF6
MSSNEELCNVLLKWLQTFQASQLRRLATIDDLTDGVVMAQVLHEIAPEWFSKMWISKIKLDVGDNWRLKVSNLKKIIEAVSDYYQEFVNQNISFVKPDAVAIGERKDVVEMVKLLQLILGCAVNCEKKQEYIKEIMLMEESVQNVIMQSIQELETIMGSSPMSLSSQLNIGSEGSGGGDGGDVIGVAGQGLGLGLGLGARDGIGDGVAAVESPANRLLHELQSTNEAKQRLALKCAELESQLNALQEERQNICEEKKSLEERLEKTMNTLSKDSGLRKQMDCLKEEIFKLETARDDYRVKLAMREKEMDELQVKFDSLQRAAAEARHLKDEVDILREDADKAEKLESTVKSYKKKLEELSELKREMKLLEEKNLAYVQQTLELEEELKKANVWRTQAEMYKKQYLEARDSLNEETKKSDKTEFENIQLREKLNAVQREKERLLVERDSLKETNEELLCSKLRLKEEEISKGTPGGIGGVDGGESAASSSSMIDLKRTLVRLQHENTLLKVNRQQSEDEKLPLLQAMYDDTSQQNKQLRNECRLANQRILQLEAELKELQQDAAVKTSSNGANVVGLETNVSQSSIKELNEQLQLEKGLRVSESTEKDRLALELKHLKSILLDALAHKDHEYEELEDKYRKCLEKARCLAKSLDCVELMSPLPPVADDNDSVRRKITHKSAAASAAACNSETIDELEKHLKRAKLVKETEEKLVISAFYNLAQKKHQECVDYRLMSSNAAAAAAATTTMGANSSNILKQRQSAIRRGPLTFNPK